MKLQIKVDPNDNTISDVKFKTFGCGSAIASSSYLTELVRGMTLEQAGRIKNTEIAKELCLPPVKRMSSSVIEYSNSPAKILSSPLLHACRRRHQVRHQQLLHQEPQSQGH
jgi:NifU-like protein involved in Fe-S cluster formation